MPITITVMKLGEPVAKLEVPAGDNITVQWALDEAGFDAGGTELRLNNQPATPQTPITESESVVTSVPKIRGGNR